MKLSRVGVDLAKNVYQLHGVDRFGKTRLHGEVDSATVCKAVREE